MNTRRKFIKNSSLSLASLCLTRTARADNPRGKKPNVILILVDDLGYGDLGCYGSTLHNTPHIDSLADGGLKFTDFHSNCPVCTPTRAALMTGHYQQRYGLESALGFGKDEGLPLSAFTLGDALKSAGYATASFGKWHLGYIPTLGPLKQGFDKSCGTNNSSDYFSHISRVGELDWYRQDKLSEEEGYLTDLITNSSTSFIEANQNCPFFLYLSHAAVHFPWQGPTDKPYRTKGKIWHDLKHGVREDKKQAYREMVESVDDSTGNILSPVKRLGLEENTLIFLISDNGGHELVASNQPLNGFKGSVLEGGHRVPALAYWPGTVPAGGDSHETVLTMDLFPTLSALAGSEIRSDIKPDGTNLLPHILEGKPLPRRTLFWRFKMESAVRRGPWKYYRNGGDEFLFNLDTDLSEKINLAKFHPGRVANLRRAYKRWEREVTGTQLRQS